MKSTDAGIRFPAIGFTPDGGMWGFADLDGLTECGARTLKNNTQSGMELIDSDGRPWVVRSIRRIGRNKPLLPWLVSTVLGGGGGCRIEQELDELAPVTLAEIKVRTCAYVESIPDEHCCDHDQDHEEEHNHEHGPASLLAQVRSANSVAEIRERLGLDWFIAY
jgi:hypothetical protein